MNFRALRRRAVLGARLALAWRPTGARLRGLLRATATSFLAIGGMLWILPSLKASGPVSVLVLVVLTFAVGAVVRPLLVAVAVPFGSFGLLLMGVLTQAVILDLALEVAPDVDSGPFRDVVLASWLVAAITAVVNWVFDVGSDDAFLARVLRQAERAARLEPRCIHEPGLLIVQVDGLGEDVLRQAITAGAAPTISRWLREGTHVLRSWHAGVPATTPASQAVLLHGDTRAVPGFRWYEKNEHRLMVANRPRDAAELERRMSDGRGLLADDGVSVANLLSGDAPVRLLTMSDPRLSPDARRGLAAYVMARGGLPRVAVLMVAEMITELQQGRRQRRRDVRPRVERNSVFVLLRAVTTVLLRNSTVSLVADRLAAGAPVVFVDFVDYDEVAHHAGPSRPESIRTLDGIDRILHLLEQLAGQVNRRYEIVVLSDHGQAQGPTFRQEAGRTLDDLVADLSDADVGDPHRGNADAAPVERWGPANVLLTGLARRRQARRGGPAAPDLHASVSLGPGRHDPAHATARPVVAASGNLAHVYLPDIDGRATVEQIESAYPRLLKGLRSHPQVGLVLARTAEDGLHAYGPDGWRVVTDTGGTGGEGRDPLVPYGPDAARWLGRLDQREHVGDLVVFGRVDPQFGDVVAFEDLVGSHGGLGGGQERAILLTPAGWERPEEPLDGPAVHRLLMRRLEQLGLRR